ncbi:nucleotide exchange factor GrpE [Candidatus Saccharibacteria bacterium]|nr:nucleotide exchange factor GrpE [Candidatus Saccharibacteria bacterium]
MIKKDKNIKFNLEVDDTEVRKEFTKLEKANAELTNQNAELLNDLQRTRADFENYRKQIEIQKEGEKKSAKFTTVVKLLPLLDDMDRAIASYQELEPLQKSLEKTLKTLNLSKIPSEAGTEFNPDLHEAITMDGEGTKEVISETLRPGYYYEGEVLRPAMVKVQMK